MNEIVKKDNHGLKILIFTLVIFFILAFLGCKAEDWVRKHHPEWFEPALPPGWKKMSQMTAALPPVFELHILDENREQAKREAESKEADRRQDRIREGNASQQDYDRQADWIRDNCG